MIRGDVEMVQRRIITLGVLIIIGILILLFRLTQIQLIETKSFSDKNVNLIEASVKQRTQEVILDNGRGKFFDRNQIPVTYEMIPSLVLFPFLKNMEWESERVADIIGVSEKQLLDAIENADEPFVFGNPDPVVLNNDQMNQINELEVPGVFAVHKQIERKESIALQLLGILGENPDELQKRYPDKNLSYDTFIGITGLQKSFDEFLLQEEDTKLVYHVDGKGGPLFGIDVKYVHPANPFYPVKINTTLDFDIQSKAEQIADQYKMEKGGLVLLDIETNSVLAMVSRPKLDINDPYQNDGAKNLMLTTSIPGSVFKTVIAAAAIDHQLVPPTRTFDCSVTIAGKPDPIFDHGILDFNNSFARSCNNTFGTLAKDLAKIDENIIDTYAGKLGLTVAAGWKGNVFHFQDFQQLADEEIGRIFANDENKGDMNFVGQTGIGQKDVRITPLAAANMMATIARGGKKEMVRAVSSIEYKNGTEMFTFHKQNLEGDNLSPYTASKLQQLLREVVINEQGTGHGFSQLPYEVAGKSGTAQTHKTTEVNGKEMEYVNKWFVGYFPFKEPKYALAVVNLDVLEGGSVYPIFSDMVNYLYEYDSQNGINP